MYVQNNKKKKTDCNQQQTLNSAHTTVYLDVLDACGQFYLLYCQIF